MIVDQTTARSIALDLAGTVSWLMAAKRLLPADTDRPETIGFARLYIEFAEQHVAKILAQLPPNVTAPMVVYFEEVAAAVAPKEPKEPAP